MAGVTKKGQSFMKKDQLEIASVQKGLKMLKYGRNKTLWSDLNDW